MIGAITWIIMAVPNVGWDRQINYNEEVFVHKEVCELRVSVLNRYSLASEYYCVDARVNDELTR